jgi:hypothetical protein
LKIVTAELKTANVAYFQRKIELSGFSAYPDGLQSKLIRISGVLLYLAAQTHSASLSDSRDWRHKTAGKVYSSLSFVCVFICLFCFFLPLSSFVSRILASFPSFLNHFISLFYPPE